MDPNQFQILVFVILILIHIVKMIIYQYLKNLNYNLYAFSIIIIIVSFMLFISLILLILKTRFNKKGKKNRILKYSLNVFLFITINLYIYFDNISIPTKVFYLIEPVLTDIWICFIFNLIILNNGRFNNIIQKFGHLGLIKQIIFIVLDVETIILQFYIIVYYLIEETIINFLTIRLNLLLNILFTLYLIYYQIKQVFKLFGMKNMKFCFYDYLLGFNIMMLVYAFIIGFVQYFKEDLDKLLIFYLYTSLRLFNLAQNGDQKFKKLLDQQIQEESQLNSIFLGSGNIQMNCQICQVQFNLRDKIIFHSNTEFLYHKYCFQSKKDQMDNQSNYQLHFQCQVLVEKQQLSKMVMFIFIFINAIWMSIMYTFDWIVCQLQFCNFEIYLQFSLISINYISIILILRRIKKLKKFFVSLMPFFNLFTVDYDKLDIHNFIIILYFQVVLTQGTMLTNYMFIQKSLMQISTLIYKHILNFFRTQTIQFLIFQIYFLITIFYEYNTVLIQIIPFIYFTIYLLYWDLHEIIYLKQIKKQLPYQYQFHSSSKQMLLIISGLKYIIYDSLIYEDIFQQPSFVLKYFLIFLVNTVITFRILLIPKQKNDKSQMNEIVKSTDIHVQLNLGYSLQNLLKCSICRSIQEVSQKFYLLNCNHAFDEKCFKRLSVILVEKCIVCIDHQVGRKYIQVILQ
ncbi:hypothetical protein pb186bvf_015914 [Paramecium bursaria]